MVIKVGWIKMANVTALVGYLFWGCGLFNLVVDNAEDKEPVEESKQKADSPINRAVICVQPGRAHGFVSLVTSSETTETA